MNSDFNQVRNAILDIMDEVQNNLSWHGELTTTGQKAYDEVRKIYDWFEKAMQNTLTVQEYLKLEAWAYNPSVGVEEPAQGAAATLLEELEEHNYFTEEELIQAQRY